MVEAIDCCFEEQNINKAKRKLKKARKLASKAGDPRLLEQISMIEQLFTLVNQNMLNMLAGMTEEDLLNMLGMVDEMEENDEFF